MTNVSVNSTNIVCVGIDDRYDESMGAYTVFYMWDGEKVYTEGGMYSNLAYNHYTFNATHDQAVAASKWAEEHAPETNANYTYVGCIVTLKRSRKAPNKTPLKVVDHYAGGYNAHYNNHEPEQIAVLVDGEKVWVSIGCVDQLVKGVKKLPFWYVAE